jgi:hypothetical protein
MMGGIGFRLVIYVKQGGCLSSRSPSRRQNR